GGADHQGQHGHDAAADLPQERERPGEPGREVDELLDHASNHLRTASTRRWSCSVGGRSSLLKMLLTSFSPAPSLTTSSWAMAALVRPSAMSASTSRSRGERRSSGSRLRDRASSWATTSGSSA